VNLALLLMFMKMDWLQLMPFKTTTFMGS